MVPALDAPPQSRRTNGQVPPAPPRYDGGDDGERDPERRRGLDNLRLAVLFLIGAETMFFGALISALFVLRLGMAVWPPPLEPRLPLAVTTVNTLVLLASSVALVAAGRVRRDYPRLVSRLALTATLGIVFLAIQGYEWVRLIGYGLTLSSGVYGTAFYGLIGVHGVHVLAAVVWLSVTTIMVARRRLHDRRWAPVQACAMFWHFVVALWPVLYIAVYVL